jgi:hypothetical protein
MTRHSSASLFSIWLINSSKRLPLPPNAKAFKLYLLPLFQHPSQISHPFLSLTCRIPHPIQNLLSLCDPSRSHLRPSLNSSEKRAAQRKRRQTAQAKMLASRALADCSVASSASRVSSAGIRAAKCRQVCRRSCASGRSRCEIMAR